MSQHQRDGQEAWKFESSYRAVVDNYTRGLHEYGPIMELIQQSYQGVLVPTME
jgi:hypothetical protein